MKHSLGLLIPPVLMLARCGFDFLLDYQQADESRKLQMPPTDSEQFTGSQTFRHSIRTIIELLSLITLIVGLTIFTTPNLSEGNWSHFFRSFEFYFLIFFVFYIFLSYFRGHVYINFEQVEIQGAFFKQQFNSEEIEDLLMSKYAIYVWKKDRRIPIILYDFRDKQNLFDTFWKIKWQASGIVLDESEMNNLTFQ